MLGISVFAQYSIDGQSKMIQLGELPSIPEIGDEIAYKNLVLIVLKKRWKVEDVAYESKCKVALLCELKG